MTNTVSGLVPLLPTQSFGIILPNLSRCYNQVRFCDYLEAKDLPNKIRPTSSIVHEIVQACAPTLCALCIKRFQGIVVAYVAPVENGENGSRNEQVGFSPFLSSK